MMNKSKILVKESKLIENSDGYRRSSGSRENRPAAILARRGSIDRNSTEIEQDLAMCQMEIINKINCREVFEKSLRLLITAREKILLYNDRAEYARRKLKEAREAIYLLDVDCINLAAEFEEKIQAAIHRLANLEDNPMRPEHKTELSHRIGEAEKIVRSLQARNDVVHDSLKLKMATIVEFREKLMAKRNQPLATRNTTNDEN